MPDSIPALHGGSGGFGGKVVGPASAGHGRSFVETLERGLQFFATALAHPEDELSAGLDEAACVDQEHAPDPLPGCPGEIFVQAPPCGQYVKIEGHQRSQPPGCVCTEATARHGAAGEAVLERVMSSLGVAAATVEQFQDRLRGHRLRPEPVLAAVARRRSVGDQHANGVVRLAVFVRQLVIVDTRRIRQTRRRSHLLRRTAM